GTPAAPTITNVAVSAITANSATITWTTDQASSTQVAYGPSISYGSTSPLVTALTTTHSVTLTGLTASSAYNFQVNSANISGRAASPVTGTFNTTGGAGPVISAVTATSITTTSATITWTTDQASNSLVN